MRLESVGNAIDMAEVVAENMLGAGKPYEAEAVVLVRSVRRKLQIAGLNTGYDQIVTPGAGRGGSVWYYRDGRLIAVDAMNDARAYMVGKRLIEAGKSPRPRMVADGPRPEGAAQ
jgi:3-phenylpropionate/trans-cinnamate dioxygenase ferredoxin reductase subunit